MRIPQSAADATQYPVGLVFDVSFQEFAVRLSVLSEDRIRFHIAEGPFAKVEEVTFKATLIRPGLFLVSWVESSGATVVHVEDFAQGTLYSHATVPDGTFLRMEGALRVVGTATETETETI
jgi:hypothetical protein